MATSTLRSKKPSSISRTKNVALKLLKISLTKGYFGQFKGYFGQFKGYILAVLGHFCFLLRLGGCGSQGLYNRSKSLISVLSLPLSALAVCNLSVSQQAAVAEHPCSNPPCQKEMVALLRQWAVARHTLEPRKSCDAQETGREEQASAHRGSFHSVARLPRYHLHRNYCRPDLLF